MNELEQLVKAASEAGAVIVLALVTYGIVKATMSSAVKIMTIWRDAARERNAIDQKRNEIDEKVANTLKAVSETLERLQGEAGETNVMITGIRRTLDVHSANSTENHENVLNTMRANETNRGNNHRELVAILEKHSEQLDSLIEKTEVWTIPPNIRGDLTKIVELVTTVSNDVKRLLPPTALDLRWNKESIDTQAAESAAKPQETEI